MLIFDFLEKGQGVVSPSYFMYGFLKYFSHMLY